MFREAYRDKKLSFTTGPDGKITSLAIPFGPSVDPIVFMKEPMIREYVVKRAGEKISIDGKLDERAWKNAVDTEEFVIHQNGAKASFATRARMIWDDDNLYVAFTVEDEDVWATMENHDEHLWNEEVVEIFIDPDGDGRNYIEIQVNPLGTTLDILLNRQYSKGGRADFGWTLEGFESAVTVEGKLNEEKGKDKRWICEVAIPFESVSPVAPSLAYPPADGDSWRINVCRMEKGRGKNDINEAVSWNPTDKRGFHVTEKFGRIIFSSETVR